MLSNYADWKKQVSISPITGLVFSPKDDEEKRGMCTLTVKNNSSINLVFKVRVTSPENYVVKPNIAIVKLASEFEFLIALVPPLDSEQETLAIKKDKF
jgi:hypothetical protein